MNTFNRIVIVISLLVLIPLVTVFLVIPHVILSDVGRWATELGRQLWAADVTVRLGIGLLAALIFTLLALVLVFLELRPQRKRFIRVENLTGGMATIGIESVVRQLEYRLDPIPDVISVKPEIQAKHGKVRALVNVNMAAGVNVPQVASRLVDEVKDVLGTELGLRVAGEPEVRINVLAQPTGRRSSQPRPALPATPAGAPATPQSPELPANPPVWHDDTGEPVV
ncbi:MAG: hypothetical protein JW892_05640 [Anaerolineae bacterium]|nr:hypothetical protein [Anaerolineae bacterium]